MRVPLEPGDRNLLIISGTLLAIITVAATVLSPPSETPSSGFPSSYSAASDGAKAGYLLLAEMGYRVERWTTPPQGLPDQPQNVTLVLVEPLIPASAEERARLRAFYLRRRQGPRDRQIRRALVARERLSFRQKAVS
jgi:hypothetical protein